MPEKKISELNLKWDEIDGAAQRFATVEELCALAGLTKVEFRRAVKHWKFLALHNYMRRMELQGKYLIRQAQFDVAVGLKEGNANLLKWMGRQHLGQREEVAELNKPNGEAPENIPAGYEILSPKATMLGGAQAAIDVTPQPYQEKPAVAAIIEAELVAPGEPVKSNPTQEAALIVVSGHTGLRK